MQGKYLKFFIIFVDLSTFNVFAIIAINLFNFIIRTCI